MTDTGDGGEIMLVLLLNGSVKIRKETSFLFNQVSKTCSLAITQLHKLYANMCKC